nr:PREDICTED: protein UXT isoform X1 [Tribolium castaneum]|eukprot:XP_008197055.2 PREDICTED: protein UXT isoform X1 [Tribolium castaneum]
MGRWFERFEITYFRSWRLCAKNSPKACTTSDLYLHNPKLSCQSHACKMMSPTEVSKKIKDYETFLEDTLKRDLADVQNILKDKVKKYKEWEEVQQVTKTINEFKEKDRDMVVRVGLGCGVHVSGEVSDYERTFVNIGLGCLLEMDCDEADKYSNIRMRSLKKDIDHYRSLAVHVKVNIKMVLLAISELQSLMLNK